MQAKRKMKYSVILSVEILSPIAPLAAAPDVHSRTPIRSALPPHQHRGSRSPTVGISALEHDSIRLAWDGSISDEGVLSKDGQNRSLQLVPSLTYADDLGLICRKFMGSAHVDAEPLEDLKNEPRRHFSF